jgi:hypothetical protein
VSGVLRVSVQTAGWSRGSAAGRESSHHIDAAMHRTVANFPDWTERSMYIHQHASQGRNVDVIRATAEVARLTKRKLTKVASKIVERDALNRNMRAKRGSL